VTSVEMVRVSGEVDDAYLHGALKRAGESLPSEPMVTELLTGGRTGAQVILLKCADAPGYVLKRVPLGGWRFAATDNACCGEGSLWHSGALRELGAGLRWPVIDVAHHPDNGEDWVLMEDVSAGFRPRGAFTRDDSKSLFRAVASMHARYYEDEAVLSFPVPTLTQQFPLLTKPQLHLAGRGEQPAWVEQMVADVQVLPAFLPIFLEIIGASGADAYLDLIADSSWHDELASHPSTLLHGDLRRANVSFEGDGIALIDWEFAALGPPAADLQEHCFLHYCAYPPDGTKVAVDACDDLRDFYVEALEAELGRSIDRDAFARSWALGFVRWIANLGCLLVDPLFPDGGSPEQRESTKQHCLAAVHEALRIVNA
jgi:hypothetical protein